MNSEVRRINRISLRDYDYGMGYGSPEQVERITLLEDRISNSELLLAV